MFFVDDGAVTKWVIYDSEASVFDCYESHRDFSIFFFWGGGDSVIYYICPCMVPDLVNELNQCKCQLVLQSFA